MISERHSLLRWLEIEGVPSPTHTIRVMKGYGIYRRGTMLRHEYERIHASLVDLIMSNYESIWRPVNDAISHR